MLSIRLQRTGRKKHAQFRVVVQDSKLTPTSGRVIANLGHYNPHTKEHGIDFDKGALYLKNGAQPSQRVVKIFTDHKVKMPGWVKPLQTKAKTIKNPDKLRRNRPAEAEVKADDQVKEPVEAKDEKDETPEDTDNNPEAEASDQPADDQPGPEPEPDAKAETETETETETDTDKAA